jgi:hypothetical protein
VAATGCDAAGRARGHEQLAREAPPDHGQPSGCEPCQVPSIPVGSSSARRTPLRWCCSRRLSPAPLPFRLKIRCRESGVRVRVPSPARACRSAKASARAGRGPTACRLLRCLASRSPSQSRPQLLPFGGTPTEDAAPKLFAGRRRCCHDRDKIAPSRSSRASASGDLCRSREWFLSFLLVRRQSWNHRPATSWPA